MLIVVFLRIILEPMAEIPAHELWVYKNPKVLQKVQEGLKQPGKHYLGSFFASSSSALVRGHY